MGAKSSSLRGAVGEYTYVCIVYLCIYESVLSKVFIFITQHNIRKQ